MNVKAASSGGKRPSSKLWAMVQRVSEDEWRQLKAFSEVYGKGSLQFKLLTLMRSMKVYDGKAEKGAFADTDLYSLRRRAKAWLIRTGKRLAFAAKEVAEQLGDVEMLVAWGHFEDAWEFVAEGKAAARVQEEFVVMAGLLEQERLVAKEIFQGEERTAQLLRIADESKANLANLQLVVLMQAYHARYMEPVRNKLAVGLGLDREAVEAYFQSEAHLMETDGLPISIQLEKLLMEEFFFNVAGRFDEAISVAEKALDLIRGNASISDRFPDLQAKVLRRLAVFYGTIFQKDKLRVLIADFQRVFPSGEGNKEHFLLKYIFVLFYAAMDLSMHEFGDLALATLEGHLAYLKELRVDEDFSVTLLYASWYCMGQGNVEKARALYREIDVDAPKLSRMLYQSMLALMHIALEIEDENDKGLEAIGLRYLRKLGKIVPGESSAMIAITVLRKSSTPKRSGDKKKSFEQLASELRRRQLLPNEERNLWYDPLVKWIEQQIATQ